MPVDSRRQFDQAPTGNDRKFIRRLPQVLADRRRSAQLQKDAVQQTNERRNKFWTLLIASQSEQNWTVHMHFV
jgi:hypothetical protein